MICIKCKADIPDCSIYCPLCGKKQTPGERKHRKRANGSGCVYKIAGNRSKSWGAKRNGIFIGSFKTYSAAQKALERSTDTDINDRYNLTFTQIYEQWKPVHARTVSSSQMGGYATSFKHCSELHDKKFRSLRKSDFQNVIIKLEQAGKSKSTCEKLMQLFGQLSKWAMDECIINQNYAQNVTTTATEKTQRTPFTGGQIKAMGKSDIPAAKIALILIASGARPNELFNVPTADCHSNYFIGGSKTNAGKNRVIPICPIGLPAYTALLQKARSEGLPRLIDAYEGNKTVSNFTKRDFKELMSAIEVEGMTTYNCRHTFVTLAVTAGLPQAQLMQIVGHVDSSTTDRYTHMDAPALVDAVSNITA